MRQEPMSANHLQTMILLVVLMFLCIGLVMVYSTSAVTAEMDRHTSSSYFFVKKQLMWLMLSGAAMLVCMEIPYRFFYRHAYVIFGFTLVLIVLVLIPGIGTEYNGARRWFRIAGIGVQPSESVKLAIVLLIARYVEKNVVLLRHFYLGFLPIFTLVGVSGFLILLEPDFGTAMFTIALATALLLIAGINWKHLLPLFLAALPAVVFLALFKFQHIQSRIMMYLYPDLDPHGKGFQIRQSLIALGSGGLFGSGVGESKQKLFYLSEESTDFIFAIIGEELGLLGTALIIVLYIILLYYALAVVRRTPDIFSTLVAMGIAGSISFQAILNIAVVTQTVPAKGISLPFISFGGSSMFFTMMGIGILANIAGYARPFPVSSVAATIMRPQPDKIGALSKEQQ